MTIPPQATISDLVPLMYRARWASFSLSGEIRTRESRSGSGASEERGSLEVTPGGRYRAEVTDEDGERDLLVCDGPGGPVPFAELMVPSLLLPDFDLRITGRTAFLGRDAIAIAGSHRPVVHRLGERVSGLNVDQVARLAVAAPGRYEIQAITDPGDKPARIVCDGERLWRAYPDRVAVRAAEPPPRGIAAIIDPAWLLREPAQVCVLGDAVVDGRPALHVMVAGGSLPAHQGPLSGKLIMSDQVEVFVDRALGICLRQVASYQGHLVLRAELTGLTTDVDQAIFDYEPPLGTKVINGGIFAEAGQSPAYVALQAGKGVAALALEVGRRWLTRNDRLLSRRAMA